MTHQELRSAFSKFWISPPRRHVEVQVASLMPKDDATTLFTSSGMQHLVRNFEGMPHELGRRLFDIQPCFRASDIEEVGDNRHTTFFEMMGNWSLGDYFKEDQLAWAFQFFTQTLGLPKEKLYVTVFEGGCGVPKDEESTAIWKKLGMPENRIIPYPASKNWWSRAGVPDEMPVGEIGGPDSEIFFEFDVPHDVRYSQHCHPNCDCGKFLEIGNSVFIQYRKKADGTLEELAQKNVDYGGGLERILATLQNNPDIFQTDVFSKIIGNIEEVFRQNYISEHASSIRAVADHLKAATLLILEGVTPSNKEQGYVLRRLLRRSMLKQHHIVGTISSDALISVCLDGVIPTYKDVSFLKKLLENNTSHKTLISSVVKQEVDRFAKNLKTGMSMISTMQKIDGKAAFDLYQSYGFPLEIIEEICLQKHISLDTQGFKREFTKHRELSKKSSSGMFTGGLADHSAQVIKYHTATHLLHRALKDVFGAEVRQEGSNITAQRLRFDFKLSRSPTQPEIQKMEEIVNAKIKEALPVHFKILKKEIAHSLGASSFFKEKYADMVKVYFIGGSEGDPSTAYSKEFCGGPHVSNTSEIGPLKIIKTKKIGSAMIRLYAQ